MKDRILDSVFNKLKKAGLKPYWHHKALTGSCYIKFNTPTNGSLRIADHPQRSRYAYRWNLRFDYTEKVIKFKGHDCYYYPFSMIEDLINDLKKWVNLK